MAGNLRIYDPTFTVIATISIGSATDVRGVCFDGVFFYITNTTHILQCQLTSAGISIIRSIDVTGLPFHSENRGIETDGTRFWLSYTGVDPGPPLSTLFRVVELDRNGTLIQTLTSFSGSSPASAWLDLVWDTKYLWASGASGLAVPNYSTWIQVNPDNDKEVMKYNLRNRYDSLTFDGTNFPGITTGSNAGHILSRRSNNTIDTVINFGGLAISSKGMCCFKQNFVPNLAPDYLEVPTYDNAHYAVVYN